MTTPLRISVSDSFSPLSGISLVSNFPLSLENLIGALELTSSGTMMGVSVTPQTTESGTLSETRFTIMPKDQKFLYGTDYILRVRTSLKPKYGTEALKEELIKSLHTNYFLTSTEPYQNVFGTS